VRCQARSGRLDQLKQIDWRTTRRCGRRQQAARRAALELHQAYRRREPGAGHATSTRTSPVIARRVRRHAHAHTVASGVDRRCPSTVLNSLRFAAAGFLRLFYWSLADFGLKPVVPVEPPVGIRRRSPPACATGGVNTLRSHYFHRQLEIRRSSMMRQPGTAGYVVVLNMARSTGSPVCSAVW